MVGGVVSGIGSIIGGGEQSSAASDAANAQTAASQSANATQLQMYNQTRESDLPQINAGNSASNQLSYLLGLQPYSSPQVDASGNPIAAPAGQTLNGMLGPNPTTSGTTTSPTSTTSSNSALGLPGNNYIFNPSTGTYQENTSNSPLSQINPLNYNTIGSPAGSSDNTSTSQTATPGTATAATDPTANNGYGSSVNTADGAYGSLASSFTPADFLANEDPAYGFDLQQGEQAIQRTQSANGGLNSGAAAEALSNYAQGQASNEYQNAYSRYTTNQNNLYNKLAGVAGTGQVANTALGTVGSNTANQISNNTTSAGSAVGAAGIGAANANSAAIGTATNQIGSAINSGGFNQLFGSNTGNAGTDSGVSVDDLQDF